MFFLSAFLSAPTHFTSLQTSVIPFFLKIFLVARWTKQWAEKRSDDKHHSTVSGPRWVAWVPVVCLTMCHSSNSQCKCIWRSSCLPVVLWFWSNVFDTQTWRTGVAHSLAAGGALTWERKFVLIPSPSSTKTSLDCFSLFSCQWLHTYRVKY